MTEQPSGWQAEVSYHDVDSDQDEEPAEHPEAGEEAYVVTDVAEDEDGYLEPPD